MRNDYSINRSIGWISLAVGAASGLTLGLWSFDGPLAVPGWLGSYDDLGRRLARLGHIAFFGLGIINILVARELGRTRLSSRARSIASTSMNVGNVGLPLALFAASMFHPLKYVLPLPACAVFLALVIMARGVLLGDDENTAERR
jgi:hypothetical protein